MIRWTLSSILLMLLCVATALGGRLTSASKQLEAAGVTSMDVQLKLSVGKFELLESRLPKGTVAEFHGDYDEAKYEYSHAFRPQGKSAEFEFESELQNHHNLSNIDAKDNRWEFGFSPEVDCKFDIEIGAAKADFDFGDLTVSDLRLDVGAADATVDFSAPNRTVLRDLKIDAGACELKVNNLGNSRFEFLNFDGGMGSFVLDFSGDFDFEAEASIDVGMGSVEIIIPANVGVRLEAEEHWFNSIDFSKRKFTRVRGREDVWETENFREATGKLTLVLDVGMGKADIKFR
jgi:hypothetical protein